MLIIPSGLDSFLEASSLLQTAFADRLAFLVYLVYITKLYGKVKSFLLNAARQPRCLPSGAVNQTGFLPDYIPGINHGDAKGGKINL
jgi:hypothetical protein